MNWAPCIPLFASNAFLFWLYWRKSDQLRTANKALDVLILQRNKLRNELDVAQRESEEVLSHALILAAKVLEAPPGHHKCSP
jgi:hypothetical protein